MEDKKGERRGETSPGGELEREGGIEEEEDVEVCIRKQLLPPAVCGPDGSSRKAPISRKIASNLGFNSK